MSQVETATLQLPKELLEAAIHHHVQLAMVEALGNKGAVIDSAVRQVMSRKVNSSGNVSNYERENTLTFIEFLVNQSLTAAVKEALAEEMVKHKLAIKKSIASELAKTKSKFAQQLIESMATAVVDNCKNNYHITVSLSDR